MTEIAVEQDQNVGSATNALEARFHFLRQELDKSAKKFTDWQKRNGKMGVVVKCLALGLSAVVTIILGLNMEPAIVYSRIALVISALTGVVSGVSAFFDFNELSLKYKDTSDKLDLLKIKFKYFELDTSQWSPESLDALKDEYLAILRETYEFFQQVRRDESDRTGKETSAA